jgi:hypothetical protein
MPFKRPVAKCKDIKHMIVEMTQVSMGTKEETAAKEE